MNTQEEKQTVERFITAYAEVLNTATRNLIPTFYSRDSLFMPDRMKTFSGHDLQTKTTGSLFKKVSFHIDYSVKDIAVDDRFAFVQALAIATTTDLLTGEQSAKTSRDFFVLRKDEDEWKIYRYMFNNVKEIR
jgi:ketosteroid isomerase-like protein